MAKSIKYKISIIYVSLIIIMLLLGSISLFNMNEIRHSVNSLITTNYNSIKRIAIMEEALNEQQTAIFTYIYEDNKNQSIVEFNKLIQKFDAAYKEEFSTIIIPKEMTIINNINANYILFKDKFEYLKKFDLYDKEQYIQAKKYYYEDLLPQIKLTKISLDNLRKSNETALFARRDEATKVIEGSINALIVLFSLATVISLVTFKYYTNRLIKPICDVTENIMSIRQGNMNRKAFVDSGDELGILCQEFNNMTQRLTEFEQSTMGTLMEERNKTLAITMSITEPLVILDEFSRVTLMNYSFEKLFNIKLEDSIGKHFLELMSGTNFIDEISKIKFHSSEFTEKIICIDSNNAAKYYNVMVTPFSYKATGDKNGVIVVFYDITEIKSLDKARIDFIATISHEFKTPLASIVMGTDLLSLDIIGELNEEQKEIVQTLCDDSQRLCTLVNDLLELSRIESSSNVYRYESCNIESIIEKSLNQFYYPAKLKEKRIKTCFGPDLPNIIADSSKIGLVINNLVSNAMKYTNENDLITISAEYKDNLIYVSVADNGVGVPPEFTEKIFEKFVQLDRCDIEARGTGIGLAASRDIITAHGGKIWCESNLEEGSCFTFTLPLMPPDQNKEKI